ncbi:MAG TPA: hypothetical protein VNW92_30290, partial [Polyangiaceae bacterium]|nr:hypothetical protein [Polyangiaceae bacterium]
MTVEVRFRGGRSPRLALASLVLGFVAFGCRIGYEPLAESALSDGGAAGSSAAAPGGGSAGDVATGASAGTASGA